jgi:hypothetical protein
MSTSSSARAACRFVAWTASFGNNDVMGHLRSPYGAMCYVVFLAAFYSIGFAVTS